MRVAPACGIDEAFQRRRGAGQHHRAILDPRPHHRHVAGVIDGAVLLLEGLLMFLIDDDQAQFRERQEQRRARAHHHPRLAVHHRAIGAAAFLLRQIGVPFGRAGTPKRAAKRSRNCTVSAISGSRISTCLSCAQRFGHRFEIDFGLARAGHAIQQMGGKFLRRHRCAQRFAPPPPDRRSVSARRNPASGAAKGANSGSSVGDQRARLDQPAHHGGRDIGVFRQARHAARQAVARHLQRARRAPPTCAAASRSPRT